MAWRHRDKSRGASQQRSLWGDVLHCLPPAGKNRLASSAGEVIAMKLFDASDPWSTIIVILVFALFGLALFTQGFSHNLSLEAGVFLVSLKLILMARKNSETAKRLERHMTRLEELLTQKDERNQELKEP
jgi:hypothetical protein